MIPQTIMLAAVEDAVMTDLEELKLERKPYFLKTICQLYGGSAENVGSGEFSNDEEVSKYEQKRYERLARKPWKLR
jgi:hypothetical protein